jgi:hypothetical protein
MRCIGWGIAIGSLGTILLYEPIKRLLKKHPGRAMREIVDKMKSNIQIRIISAVLLKDVSVHDRIGQIRVIFRFVADRIRYMKDPFKKEHLANPLETLQVKAGDCDCKSILLATILESCGFETQFVLVPKHVFVRVRIKPSDINRIPPNSFYIKDQSKYWIPLESTAKGAPIGWMSKKVYVKLIKKQEYYF